MFAPCAIIPCFNHKTVIAETIETLYQQGLSIILIDDGSELSTQRVLEGLARQYSSVNANALHLFRINSNQGKGAAVLHGFECAASLGFTHAIQIDADGQHDLEDVPRFLAAARSNPHHIIAGAASYDDSVPKGRYIGRYITHFWVWVETLSFDIKDSMCGFRVYPLAETLRTKSHAHIGRRMDFDTEVIVRLYWDGCDVLNLETKVIYPRDGVSHFKMLQDNVRISLMHTRLFFGMLKRLPKLLKRKIAGKPVVSAPTATIIEAKQTQHWSRQREKGVYIGLKFLYLVYKYLGKTVFSLILHPVVLFFFLTSPDKRKASRQYLAKVNQHSGCDRRVRWIDSYLHFIAFGYSALDKLIAWLDKGRLPVAAFHGEAIYQSLESREQGAVFLGSHLGNLEYCRALSRHVSGKIINAVVFTEHAANFNRMLKEINPTYDINLIPVSSIGADTAILFREKIERGEILVIVGDRTSPFAESRNVYVELLGQLAAFPQGPFVLASLMDCPVYLLFCLREDDGYHIYLEDFKERIHFSRRTRDQVLKELVSQYARRLEHHCARHPRQWFNFFDFWAESATEYKSS